MAARRPPRLGAPRLLSIEWSRIFPAPTDAATTDADLRALASPAAVAHYHAPFAALRVREIAKYAGFCAREFGAEVGVVFPIAPFEPADASNPLDVEGAKNGFYLYDMV